MLAAWTEILPVFVVRWLSKLHCERVNQGGVVLRTARPDVFFKDAP